MADATPLTLRERVDTMDGLLLALTPAQRVSVLTFLADGFTETGKAKIRAQTFDDFCDFLERLGHGMAGRPV